SPTGTSWPSSVPEPQPAARATTAAIPAAARTAGRMRVRIMTVLLWGSASGMGSGYEAPGAPPQLSESSLIACSPRSHLRLRCPPRLEGAEDRDRFPPPAAPEAILS